MHIPVMSLSSNAMLASISKAERERERERERESQEERERHNSVCERET